MPTWPISEKTDLSRSHSVQIEHRLQVPLSSKPAFKSTHKGIVNPFHCSAIHHAGSSTISFIPSLLLFLSPIGGHSANIHDVSVSKSRKVLDKIKSDCLHMCFLVQDIVSTQDTPSSCHTLLPSLTLH